MRSCKADQIGAPCHQDRIDMIGLENIAHGHGFHTRIVANAVRHRRLEHAAIDGAGFGAGLACAYVDDVSTCGGKGTGDVDGLFGVTPMSCQSVDEIRTAIGLAAGHTARMASKTSNG